MLRYLVAATSSLASVALASQAAQSPSLRFSADPSQEVKVLKPVSIQSTVVIAYPLQRILSMHPECDRGPRAESWDNRFDLTLHMPETRMSYMSSAFGNKGIGPNDVVTFNVDVGTQKTFEFWIECRGAYTDSYYDSKEGQNYKVEVAQVPQSAREFKNVLFFNEVQGSNAAVHGDLKAGGEFKIDILTQRVRENSELLACKHYEMAADGYALRLSAGIRFNSLDSSYQEIPNIKIVDSYGMLKKTEHGTIRIPAYATSMEMWFFCEDENGGRHYDSNMGSNYSFNIQPL